MFNGRGDEPQWLIKTVDYRHMKEGGMHEQRQAGEQSWRRWLASLLRGFKQRWTSLRTRSEDEGKALRWINILMSSVRKMSAVGRRGKGLRWNVSQQLAEICDNGWMNDVYEPLWERMGGLVDKRQKGWNCQGMHEAWWLGCC